MLAMLWIAILGGLRIIIGQLSTPVPTRPGGFHGCVWYQLHTDQDPKFFAAIKTILLDQILVLTPNATMTCPHRRMT